MKKTAGVLLACSLLVLLQTTALAAPANTPVFTLSGDAALRETHITDAAQVQAMQELLERAQPLADTASLRNVETAGTLVRKTEGQKEAVYTLLRDSEHQLYARQNGTVLRLPTRDFLSLTTQMAADLYAHRALPQATIAYAGQSLSLPVAQSSYGYKRIDGLFVRPEPPKSPALATLPLTGGLYVPSLSPAAQSMTLRVTKDGKEVFAGDAAAARDVRLRDSGTYTVLVTAKFSDEHYKGTVAYRYTVSDSAGVTFSAQGSDTTAGEAVVLRASGVPDGQTVTAETNLNFSPVFFREPNGDWVSLLPVSVFTQPGEYFVTVRSGPDSQRFAIRSRYKQFDVQQLTVAPATAEQTILSQRANEEYAKIINPLKAVSDSTRHWQGRFVLPVSDKRVTTTFGTIRYTNGSKDGNVHGALDLAVPQGTPVAASGSGRVLYAGFLQLTGNTVLLEHGYGLKTWYYHMHTLDVSTGDMVRQGQQIGTVGSTGFSTGPHLHFGMTVNNLSINPYTAIQTDLLALDGE